MARYNDDDDNDNDAFCTDAAGLERKAEAYQSALRWGRNSRRSFPS